MTMHINAIYKLAVLILLHSLLMACSTFATTNEPLSNTPSVVQKAQFEITQDRGSDFNKKSLVILALSGGGSRAAVFSSNVMLGLEKVFADDGINLLKEVDVISSVSGGSLPAAYYAVSQDPQTGSEQAESGRYWDDETVIDLMTKNYIFKWFGNWFWPNNIFKYWFTAYDRSDIMAQTFADNLFDESFYGYDLTFADINPERPYLIINATNGTTSPEASLGAEEEFSAVFTFTSDDFTRHINSDIYQYEVSRAVMASASFPAVFNFMTLADYRPGHQNQYLHVFDGGNADNLGLTSALRVIKTNPHYERVIVILIDAFNGNQGISSNKPDARSFFSFFVDLNFVDSSNSLLENNRRTMIKNFREELNKHDLDKTIFYHFRIEDVTPNKLRTKLARIATDFRIKDDDAAAIKAAVDRVIVKENICLQKIRGLLIYGSIKIPHDSYCTWKSNAPFAQN